MDDYAKTPRTGSGMGMTAGDADAMISAFDAAASGETNEFLGMATGELFDPDWEPPPEGTGDDFSAGHGYEEA